MYIFNYILKDNYLFFKILNFLPYLNILFDILTFTNLNLNNFYLFNNIYMVIIKKINF